VFCYPKTGEPIPDFKRERERASTAVKMPDFHVHDLRRRSVRDLIRTGTHECLAMDISGHKNEIRV
jgi:integrase